MAWLSVPEGGIAGRGVLILPPIGYPYWSAHRTLRTLAEGLAAQGLPAMRLDYEGTGDSGGGQWDARRLPIWRRSAGRAATELARLGCSELTVIGVRLGATIALLDGASLGADAVVAWAPVVSGRRFVKETRLLSTPVPEFFLPSGVQSALVAAGTVFTGDTLDEIAALSLERADLITASRTLLVDSAPHDELARRLSELGSRTRQLVLGGGQTALEMPAEYATVPTEIVRGIIDWATAAETPIVTAGARAPRRLASSQIADGPVTARIATEDCELREQILRIGATGLVGVMTERLNADAPQAMIVFLNSGSEPHIGSGRAWVEYARALARAGHRCLRVDFRGWGESPDDALAPGRPYDAHCEQDTVAIVRALREQGEQRIVLVGLCASAWIALRAILSEPVEGVVALNPQMYWQPGDPVEATMQETRARRTPQRLREERARRLGIWGLLDRMGHRPWAARWLDDISRTRIPVLLAFAGGDDGIEFLHNRVGRRLSAAVRAGSLAVTEMPDIDHSMHRVWLRETVVRAIDDHVRAAVSGRC